MQKNQKDSNRKLWIGFGIVTVISGIFLVFSKDYVIGISGSIVGIGLIMQNLKEVKDKTN